MTAGLPGAGIGGLFYLASALLMPFRQLYSWLRGHAAHPARGWRVALSQAALALAIFGTMWGTGWSVGWLLQRPWTEHLLHVADVQPQVHAGPLALLGLVLSLLSLVAVLVVVEVVRLALRRPADPGDEAPDDADRRPTRSAAAAAVLLALAALLCDVQPLIAQASPHPRTTVASARGHPVPLGAAAAARGDSLAPETARALAVAGRTDAAIRAYESWLESHPADVAAWRELGRQRQRAGRLAAAAGALERAQELEPDPATHSRLAAIRVGLRPAVEPLLARSGDSDATTRWVGGLEIDAAVARGRIGVRAARTRASDGAAPRPATADLFSGTLRLRPAAMLDLDLAGGVARTRGAAGALDSLGRTGSNGGGMGNGGMGNGNGAGNGGGMGGGNGSGASLPGSARAVDYVGPTGRLRLRFRGVAPAPSLELRASSAPVDASANLIAAHVWRDEVGGTLEVPIGPLRLRGTGKAGDLRMEGDRNSRMGYGGGLALAASPAVQLSAQFNHAGYAHAATGPYFAPRLAETLDAGSYIETSLGDAVSLAADVAAGVGRLGRFGEPNGAWGPELRFWSLLSWTAAPGRELRVEAEAYDSRAGDVLTSASAGHWRYASVSTSLRLSIP